MPHHQPPLYDTTCPTPDLRSDVVAPLPGDVRNYLEAHNNTLKILYPPYPGVNGITKEKDAITSWSDSRSGGVAHRIEPPLVPEKTKKKPGKSKSRSESCLGSR